LRGDDLAAGGVQQQPGLGGDGRGRQRCATAEVINITLVASAAIIFFM
jgi:hypothetical protein